MKKKANNFANFLRKMLFFDPHGAGIRKRKAVRNFERVATVMERQTYQQIFASCFSSAGSHIRRTMSNHG